MLPSPISGGPHRPRVVIAGGGVAGLETLLALRALAGDRVEITLVAPELKFINRSMSVAAPFGPRRVRGISLEDISHEFDAQWVRAELDRVVHRERVAVTTAGDELPYDRLVLAQGARPVRWAWRSLLHPDGSQALIYSDGRDSADYRLLLARLQEGAVSRVAFVKPAGTSWPLPMYDLALLTAAECAVNDRTDVELCLVTPEEEPLAVFGATASAAVGRLLAESGVALHTASYGQPSRPGWLDIAPGDRGMPVDRVVTEPRLAGPRTRGVPSDRDGFVPTDAHGRVPGVPDVFAAGDAASFPVKQGGLAAQQADAVAETIAASVGADVDPQPFRPVLRGLLLTGGPARYLRSDISGTAGDDSTISEQALWWPPDKLAGRYLAPFLSRQSGDALDVHPPDDAEAVAVENEVDGSPRPGPGVLRDQHTD